MRVAALILLGSVLAPVAASPVRAQGREQIPIQFPATSLQVIVDQLAPALGERFVYDDSLVGNVTITVPRPVSRGEAWQILHAALAMKGFAALPIPGGGYKVVPLSVAGDSDPWTLEAPSPTVESRILTLIPVRTANVLDLVPLIGPLLDPTTIVIPSPTTNSLLIATSERRLAGVIALIRGLDVSDVGELRIRKLRWRDAGTALDVLEARFGDGSRWNGNARFWADDRLNAVIYQAPPPRALEITAILDDLDRPTDLPGEIHVIRLHHAEAESVAQQLQQLAEGGTDPAGAPTSRSPLAGEALVAVADPGTQSLVVNASPEVVELVREIVAELDRPPAQVAVDVLVQEWAYDEGFDLSLIGATIVGGNPVVGIQSTPLPGGFRGESFQDALLIRAINLPHQVQLIANQSEVDSVTLLRPHLVLMSGEEQSLFVGSNVPVPVAPSEGASGGGGFLQQTTIERRDVGIDLRLRAAIGETGAARLEVSLEIERLRSSLTGSPQEVGPTFTQRGVQTTTSLLPGQALLIAGQTQSFVTRTRSGVPFLMDIPFIGTLFSAISETPRRGRIVISLQATALPDPEALEAYSIERRVAFDRAVTTREAIGIDEEAGYAVRLGSFPTRQAAAGLARRFETDAHPAHLVAWSGFTDDYVDVYLTGYSDYATAAERAYELNTQRIAADVVPLGDAEANLR